MKIYLLGILMLLMSCGSRKVQLEKVEVKKDSVVQITSEVRVLEASVKQDSTNVKLDITEDEITFTPVDSTKEIIVDGKSYKNVVLRIKKIRDNSIYKNNNTVSQIKRIDSVGTTNIKETSQTNVKTKVTEKTAFYGWMLWLIILLVFAYILWKSKLYPFK